MRFRLLLILLALFLIAKGLGWCQSVEPQLRQYSDGCNTHFELAPGLWMQTLVYCPPRGTSLFPALIQSPQFVQSLPVQQEQQVEPQKITCNVLQPIERPGVWDVYIVTDPTPTQRVNQWVSEHQSRKSALKACDKIITVQEKLWKRERKKK